MARAAKKTRNTRQLEVVWHAVKDDKTHPTADQIYDRLHRKYPKLSLGTVYRNLAKLVSQGRLQVLMLGRSRHFDPLVKRHQHFICECCDRVFDIMVESQREARPPKLSEEGFTVTSQHLSFYGACKQCAGQ
jgi:Fe2+ or Zn2+ uptake regulation protein